MTPTRKWIFFSLIPLLCLAVVMISLVFVRVQSRSGSSQSYAYQGTALVGEAPEIQLVNQLGASISLSSLKNNIVVLTFMDSSCIDICPLISLHLRSAYQKLISAHGNELPIVFIGVNVNIEKNEPKDVLDFSIKNGLFNIPTWHFLTGSPQQLQQVWEAYNISVVPSQQDEAIIHTPGVYLIDQNGGQAWYIAVPVRLDSTWEGPSLSELLEMRINQMLSKA